MYSYAGRKGYVSQIDGGELLVRVLDRANPTVAFTLHGGRLDRVYMAAAGMPEICTNLEMHMIGECGYWTQQEKPDELSRLMLDWLKRRF